MNARGPLTAENVIKGGPPAIPGSDQRCDREEQQEVSIAVCKDDEGISVLRPPRKLRLLQGSFHQPARPGIVPQRQEQDHRQGKQAEGPLQIRVRTLRRNKQKGLPVRGPGGNANLHPQVVGKALEAGAGLVVPQVIRRLLADHFGNGMGDKAAVLVPGGGGIPRPHRKGVDRVFIAHRLQRPVQIPGAVNRQQESVRRSLRVLHQDCRADLGPPRIGVRLGADDRVGISQQHRLVILAEVLPDGKVPVAVAGDQLPALPVKAHDVFRSGGPPKLLQPRPGQLLRVLLQVGGQQLGAGSVVVLKAAPDQAFLALPPFDLPPDEFPHGLGGRRDEGSAFQQKQHIGKKNGDRQHDREARPGPPPEPAPGASGLGLPGLGLPGLLLLKLSENIVLEQQDAPSDDQRNGQGNEGPVAEYLPGGKRHQELHRLLSLRGIAAQPGQKALPQQGDVAE